MHSPVRRIAESFGSPQNQMHEMKNLHDRRRFLKSILKWLELWGLLFCGHLLAGLIFTKAGASCTQSFIDVLIMAIPLSALVVAATGPLAIVGFAGMIITWIVKSFDEDVDYYVPVAEIEKLENQHFDEITKAGLKNGN